MKFILAALVLAFTVGFASPSFADDDELECSGHLYVGDLVEPVPAEEFSEAETERHERCRDKFEAERHERIKEWAESEAEQNAAEAEAEAKAEAELVAENEEMARKHNALAKAVMSLPVDPQNHCEFATGMLKLAMSGMMLHLKRLEDDPPNTYEFLKVLPKWHREQMLKEHPPILEEKRKEKRKRMKLDRETDALVKAATEIATIKTAVCESYD